MISCEGIYVFLNSDSSPQHKSLIYNTLHHHTILTTTTPDTTAIPPHQQVRHKHHHHNRPNCPNLS
ncbi:hypothetical protein HanRHA438_Chr01g0003971 [Helianthus annuus]|nr:hypothetical protein HanRHA438_Chr01g0003971 [Helianthus annuus]